MKEFVKVYCDIPALVTIYDEKIENLILFAMKQLEIAGVTTDENNEVVKEFVATYCRLRLISEPSKVFQDSENKRLGMLIELLTYGGQ